MANHTSELAAYYYIMALCNRYWGFNVYHNMHTVVRTFFKESLILSVTYDTRRSCMLSQSCKVIYNKTIDKINVYDVSLLKTYN